MESNSKPFLATAADLGETSGNASPAWNALQTFLLSPALLVCAIVQLLCHPLARRLLIAIMILDIPIQCGIHLGFREDAALIGAIEGFDVSITTIALCGLYIGWIFTEKANHRPLRFSLNWPIVAFTAATVASLAVARDPMLSIFQVVLLSQMLLLYVYVASNIDSREEISYVVKLLLTGVALEAVVMLAMAATGSELSFLRAIGIKPRIDIPKIPGGFIRQGGTVGSPNYSSAYLGMLMTLAIAVRQSQSLWRYRRFALIGFVLGAMALVSTFSRGGWIGIMVSLAVFGWSIWRRGAVSRKAAVVALVAVVIVAAFLFIPNPVSARMTANDEGSAHSRVPLMNLAFRVITANPILGVGGNNFGIVMPDYAGSEFRHEWIYTVHNQFLLVCAETGVIGFIAYMWIFLSLIRKGWQLWKVGDDMFSPLALSFVAAVCGLMAHMLVDIFSDRPLMQLIWLCAALMTAMEVILKRERASELLAPRAVATGAA